MAFWRAAALIGTFLLSLNPAAAQDLTLTEPNRWVVVASRPLFQDAKDIAQIDANDIDGVRVVRTGNGLHAIIFGPVVAKSIKQVQDDLDGRFWMPGDAFLSRGEKFTVEYEAPRSPILAYRRFDGTTPVAVRYGHAVASMSRVKTNAGSDVPVLRVRMDGPDVEVGSVQGTVGSTPRAEARFVRLTRKSGDPDIVFTSYSGGAHCCTSTKILTLQDNRNWRVLEADAIDGDGYSFEDVEGTDTAELVSVDNSFLYKFEAYSGSLAPPIIYRIVENKLVMVTTEPGNSPFVRRALRQMEYAATKDQSLWSNNGYLGGWVATKALLGEVDDAWQKMLAGYDRNPSFVNEECLIQVQIYQCPADQKRVLPFPEALRKHLVENGYPVPVIAVAAPVVTKFEAHPSSSGSAFFITGDGNLITNAHVVEDCAAISVAYGPGQVQSARLVARDQTNDLAILKVDASQTPVARFRSGVRLGEEVAAFGFPLFGLLSSGGNFTLGNVTALAGLRDDSRMLQISVPVQPGNSGGPLLDESGAVVGIVVSKLNAIRLALATADMAQNVNFAIKAVGAQAFAEAQGLKIQSAPADGPPLRPADLADLAKSITALVGCSR